MVELEERIVYSELVTFEPFEKVTDDGQPVDDRGSHGGVGGGVGVVSLDGVQYYLIKTITIAAPYKHWLLESLVLTKLSVRCARV